MDNDAPLEEDKKPKFSEVMLKLRANPKSDEALRVLDIVDSKVSALFTFIGILIAAVLIFASSPEPTQWLGEITIYLSLAVLLIASLLCLSCLNLIDIRAITARQLTTENVFEKLDQIAASRRKRYLIALGLTVVALFSATISVVSSI
ncbi:MAG: hypothetical protein AAGF20_10495 [Pseudomonadota bacterium]